MVPVTRLGATEWVLVGGWGFVPELFPRWSH